jgi:hypothetical protein
VARTHDAEQTPVERRESSFAQPLHDRKHRGIDVSDTEIAIRRPQLEDADDVVVTDMLNSQQPALRVAEYVVERGSDTSGVTPVVKLGEDRLRDDHIVRIIENSRARSVIRVAPIERREKRAGIDDEHR